MSGGIKRNPATQVYGPNVLIVKSGQSVAAAVTKAAAAYAAGGDPQQIITGPGVPDNWNVSPAGVRTGSLDSLAAPLWLMTGHDRSEGFQTSWERLHAWVSGDGLAWSPLAPRGLWHPPNAGRDYSIIRWKDKWYATYGFPGGSLQETSFGVASSSDLVTWTEEKVVEVWGGVFGSWWAPEWFIDPANGSLHIFLTGMDNDTIGYRAIWEIHPIDPDTLSGSWSDRVLIDPFTGATVSYIDPFVVYRNGQYHIWVKNDDTDLIQYASSSSLTSGYTLTTTGDWAGFGSGIEAPSIVQLPDGRWRLYVDKEGTGIYYSETDGDTWAAGHWSTSALVRVHGGFPQGVSVHLFRNAAMATEVLEKRVSESRRTIECVYDREVVCTTAVNNTYVKSDADQGFTLSGNRICRGLLIVAAAPTATGAGAGTPSVNYAVGSVVNADGDLIDATDIDIMIASTAKTAASTHGDAAADHVPAAFPMDGLGRFITTEQEVFLNLVGASTHGGDVVGCVVQIYAFMDLIPS